MKVWWCLEHETPSVSSEVCPTWLHYQKRAPCRMVEMQLVPADARMVSGEKGQKVWWCVEHDLLADVEYGGRRHCRVSQVAMQADTATCRVVEAWLTVESPEEPPKDPWDYDP